MQMAAENWTSFFGLNERERLSELDAAGLARVMRANPTLSGAFIHEYLRLQEMETLFVALREFREDADMQSFILSSLDHNNRDLAMYGDREDERRKYIAGAANMLVCVVNDISLDYDNTEISLMADKLFKDLMGETLTNSNPVEAVARELDGLGFTYHRDSMSE
jgi:hypothetical protein